MIVFSPLKPAYSLYLCLKIIFIYLITSYAYAIPSSPPPESSGSSWLSGLGVKINATRGRVYLNSSAQGQPNESSPLAQGQASLDGYGISLFSRPKSGWQISPSFGFQSFVSLLKDEVSIPQISPSLAGRFIGSSCAWANEQTQGSCHNSNQYQLEVQMIYIGAWAGYISNTMQLHSLPLLASYKVGLEWSPFNLVWAKSSINRTPISDEIFYTWSGGLLAQIEGLIEWKDSQWLLSLAFNFGQLATISYSTPLEFQGDPYCDESGCKRLRSYTDETKLQMWNFCLSLIKTWY